MAETIYAVSSGRPPAAIAVFRISGPNALSAAASLAGTLPRPRHAALRRLRSNGVLLDMALVIVFPGPRSATGEDLVELHCHGGRAVVAAVERALSDIPHLRPAIAGEFTRRALIHGRIDLSEAQGLADLLEAETEAQRRAALDGVEGRVGRAVRGWLDRVTMLAAQAEAALDFSDEDDVADDPALLARLRDDMAGVASDIAGVLAAPAVDRLRDGIRVVLAGPPNSGKSTLLNCLAEREVAIVSPIAGTTRDRIEVAVARGGLPFLLTDTAGLRDDHGDAIEEIGIGRARDAVRQADLLLWLGEDAPPSADAIWIHTRADQGGRESLPVGRTLATRTDQSESIDRLWAELQVRAERLVPRPDQLGLDRDQRRQCQAAAEALAAPWSDPLIGAELLRQGQNALAGLLGINATETMLDALFSRFCIGK